MELAAHLFHIARNGSGEEFKALFQSLDSDYADVILNTRNKSKYSLLHVAIFSRNKDVFDFLVENGANVNTPCHGTPPMHLLLHIRCLPHGVEFADHCWPKLISSESFDFASKDDQGLTVLHLCAEFGFESIAEAIVDQCGNDKEIFEAKDRSGLRPVHRAAKRNSLGVMKLLLSRGARHDVTNYLGLNILHFAAIYGSSDVWDYLTHLSFFSELSSIPDKFGRSALETKNEIWLSESSSDTSTVVFTDYLCQQHYTCPPSALGTQNCPPENVRRLQVLLDDKNGVLRSQDLSSYLSFSMHSHAAPISEVLRVHEWSYVRKIQYLCEHLTDDPESDGGMGSLDGDTSLSKQSWQAALHAVGAACQAVDAVCSGKARNAFCPIRPPGHHAGPRGPVKGESGAESHGFCLLNNVAIAASYAMNHYSNLVKRVAIVDFDVHHGNGTEESVRWLHPTMEEVPVSHGFVFGQLFAPRFKPWHDFQDSQNVLFVSVHGYGPRDRELEEMMPQAAFYPGSGRTSMPNLLQVAKLFQRDVDSDTDDAKDITDTQAFSNKREMNITSSAESFGNINKSTDDSSKVAAANNEAILSNKEEDHEDDGDVDNQGEDEDEGEEEDDEDDEENDDSNDNDGKNDQGENHETGDEFERNEGDIKVYDDDEGDDDEDDDESFELDNLSVDEESSAISADEITRLKKVYKKSSNAEASLAWEDTPLILDVGVRLPEVNNAMYRSEWRNYFRDDIFPRLSAFQPDLILISAGFDAHKKDMINGGYIALVEEDFEWVTSHLVRLANSCCNGRVVSVLEGGYELNGEMCSAFAKSVKSHVFSLANGALARRPYCETDLHREKEVEEQVFEEIEKRKIQKMLEQEAAILAANSILEDDIAGSSYVVQQEPASNSVNSVDDVVQTTDDNLPIDNAEEEPPKKRRRSQVNYLELDAKLQAELHQSE